MLELLSRSAGPWTRSRRLDRPRLGQSVVWNMASHHSDKTVGVASLCVPYLAVGFTLENRGVAGRPQGLSGPNSAGIGTTSSL